MSWLERVRDQRRLDEAATRAQQVYDRREDMLQEIVPLATVGLTADDIQVCLGCGDLVLRGWKDMHVNRHAWRMSTNPIVHTEAHSFDKPRRLRNGDPAR